MKQFLSSDDVFDVNSLLQKAKKIKQGLLNDNTIGNNKTMVLLFFNPSLRTRLSTQKAAQNLGMHVIAMNVSQAWGIEFEDGAVMNLDKAEHVKEAAAVISQYAVARRYENYSALFKRRYCKCICYLRRACFHLSRFVGYA